MSSQIIKRCLENLTDYSKLYITTSDAIHTFYLDDYRYYWYTNSKQVGYYPQLDSNLDQFTNLIDHLVDNIYEIKFNTFNGSKVIFRK